MSKRKLGRGLGSLLGDALAEEGKVISIPLSKVHPNPWQPRRTFNEEGLKDLAASIKEKGLLQPVTVRYKDVDGNFEYELAAGERRLRAAKLAGLVEIPAILTSYDDETMAEMAIIENLQREDLNPMEESDAYALLMKKYNFTQDAMAKKIGKSRSYVANLLRLASLPAEVQDMVRDGKLSFTLARLVMSLATPAEQLALARKIAAEGLSVREAKELVTPKQPKKKKTLDPAIATHLKAIEQQLGLGLGSKVHVKLSGKSHQKGTITISFQSEEEFERLTELLSQQ